MTHFLARLLVVRRQARRHLELAMFCGCGPAIAIGAELRPTPVALGTFMARPATLSDDWAHGGGCWTYRRTGERAELLEFTPSLRVRGHFHTPKPWHVAIASVEGWPS